MSVLREEEKALADSDVAPHRNDSAIRWPRSHRQTAKLWNFATSPHSSHSPSVAFALTFLFCVRPPKTQPPHSNPI